MDGILSSYKSITIRPKLEIKDLKKLNVVIVFLKTGSQTSEEIGVIRKVIRDAGYTGILTDDKEIVGKKIHAYWSRVFAVIINDLDFFEEYKNRRWTFALMYREQLVPGHIEYDLTHSSVD